MTAPMTLMTDDINACAGIVQSGDPDRFYAVMSAAPVQRGPLFVLCAFNLEVARSAWASQEVMVGQMRLQFWRDVIEAATGDGPVREHEVARPLVAVIREHALPGDVLDALVAARWWDLNRESFADEAAFWAHIDATAGGLLWLCAKALGAPDAAGDAVRGFGRAQGLAAWFQAVPALEKKGRFPLADGRVDAIKTLAKQGLAELNTARKTLGKYKNQHASWQVSLRAAWQAEALLKQVVRDPGVVARDGLELSGFQKKRLLMMKTLLGRI